jgi:hypothetical protein
MPLPTRRPRHAVRFALVAAGILSCTTCDYGEVVVVAPAAVGHGPLTLSIQASPEDSAVARELGWSRGIPGAEVTVSPANDTATGPPIAVLQTDSTGAASVSDLPDGQYHVEVRRHLTAAEMAAVVPAEDVNGFFGQAVVKRGPITLQVPASRRHSLVISEWSFNGEYDRKNKWGDYNFGGYLELANNSDTTVYLDGLVVGMAYAQASEYAPPASCKQSESFSNDPDGVWARQFDSLPGTGHTYPLAPGETAVIATDAIDHSAIWPGALDLRGADFEFIGTADADNPAVPNTIDIGLGSNLLGHGLIPWNAGVVVFVALPLDVAPLPRQRILTTGNEYARVPRTKILDVVALLHPGPIICRHLVHNNFDRDPARMMSDDYSDVITSVNRKVAYTRADGRKILQHTRTAAVDFFRGPRTPGRLP